MQLRTDQQTLATMQQKLADKSHLAVGAMGEETAAALLRESGYLVVTTGKRGGCGDLRAIEPETGETWKVEVKTARRGSRGWQFCLSKHDKHGHTSIKDSHFLMLLAVLKSGRSVVFLIPVSEVIGLKTITIYQHPEDYHGKYAGYRCKGQRINLGVGQ